MPAIELTKFCAQIYRWPRWLLISVLAVIYFHTAQLGLQLDPVSGFATLVWPPTGLALGMLLLFGLNLWPGIWLGAFLINWSTGAPIFSAVGIAIGNTTEVFLIAYCLQRYCHLHNSLDRIRDVASFVILVVAGTLVGAVIGVFSLWLGNIVQFNQIIPTWRAWWIGDMLGALVLAPVILIWAIKDRFSRRMTALQALEIALLVASSTAVGAIVFHGWSDLSLPMQPFPYVLFPFSVWAALRFGQRGAASSTLLIAIVAIAGTTQGFGPFGVGNLSERLLFLQTFIAILGITAMVLAASLAERDLIEASLRDSEQREMFLNEAGRILASSSICYDTTLANIVNLAVPRFADYCFVDLLEDDDVVRRVKVSHADPTKSDLAEKFQRYPPAKGKPDPVSRALFKNEPIVVSEINERIIKAISRGPEHERAVRAIAPTSFLTVPMIARGKTIGALTLISTKGQRRYSGKDLALYKELGRRAAFAVDNARQYKIAQDAIQARDDFLSIASHELKTPITSLALQTQMIKRAIRPEAKVAPTPETLAKAMDLSGRQLNRLADLVEDLLDVSKIQAGKLKFTFENVNLSGLIKDMIERFSGDLDRSQCKVQVELDPTVSGNWDRARLEQTVANLLTNAMKYAPGTEISIVVDWKGDHARFTVQDLGPGIPKDKQKRIFERYERVEGDTNISGMGLGLFIANEIVQGHRGLIHIESDLGKGSKFIVELPKNSEDPIQGIDETLKTL